MLITSLENFGQVLLKDFQLTRDQPSELFVY